MGARGMCLRGGIRNYLEKKIHTLSRTVVTILFLLCSYMVCNDKVYTINFLWKDSTKFNHAC